MGKLPAPYGAAQALLVATQNGVGARRLVALAKQEEYDKAQDQFAAAAGVVRAARRAHAAWVSCQEAWARENPRAPQTQATKDEWTARAARLFRAQVGEDEAEANCSRKRQELADAQRDYYAILRSMETDPLVQLAESKVEHFDFLKQPGPPWA